MDSERYKLVLEVTSEGFWDWDLKTDKAYLSPRYCSLVGYSPEDTIFDSNFFKMIIHPDDRDQVFKTIEEHLQGKRDISIIEYRMISRDGTIRWIEGRGKIVEYDDQGSPARMVGTIIDITERKNVDENVFIKISSLTDLIVARFDRNLRHQFVTPSIEEVTGFPSEFFIGKSNREIGMPERLVALWEKAIEEVFETGKPNQIEFSYSSPKGPVYFTSDLTPEYSSDGSMTHVICISRNITERKKAETALSASNERLKIALAASKMGVWDWDLLSNTVQWSPEVYDIVGLQEFNGNFDAFARLLHPEDAAHVIDTVNSSLAQRETYTDEFRIIRPDGKLRWLFNLGRPTYDSNGKPIRLIGTVQDITDRKRAEEERAKLEAQLHQAQKMESVGNLAGGVAHDFNNKLGVILGHAYLALSESIPGTVRDSLEEIRKAAEQSADLTRQLLAFARKQTIAPKVMDLNETVTSMLKMLHRLIGEDIRLVWQPAPDLWLIKFDPSQVDQILANLCVNARDSIDGVGTITIETWNSSIDDTNCANHADAVPGEYVRLVVSDNGCGMDDGTLERIFDPFFTTKDVGKGTGLGLAMVFGIVKQNGGFIHVFSEPGLGTTFTVYIPRYRGTSDHAPKDATALPVPRGLETILLVEDELAILNMVAKILVKQGYNVLWANTPVEAIKIAKEHVGEISLLITDVIMPEMNGKDLANTLLSLNSHLKCLFMSGYTANAIAQHGVLDDGVHFIQKPFSLSVFANKVHEVLNGGNKQ